MPNATEQARLVIQDRFNWANRVVDHSLPQHGEAVAIQMTIELMRQDEGAAAALPPGAVGIDWPAWHDTRDTTSPAISTLTNAELREAYQTATSITTAFSGDGLRAVADAAVRRYEEERGS